MKNFLSWARRPRAGAAGHILTLLVAICLTAGGTAYAANTIGSADIIDGSVQGVDIKDRTIRAPDLVGAPWISVKAAALGVSCASATGTYCSNADGSTFWQNYGFGYQGVRFRRDATNMVTLQGRTDYLHLGSDLTTLFYLPANYRPTGKLVFQVNCSDPGHDDVTGAVEIATNGAVDWYGNNNQCTAYYIDLTGISFPIN